MRPLGRFEIGSRLLVLVLAWLVPAAPVSADLLRLKGGGEIRGRIVRDPARPGKVLVQTGTLSEPVVLDRDRIADIVDEPDDALDDYHARKDRVPQTAQAQYDFGLWCDSHRLPALAEVHYRRAVALDKNFAPARTKLGQTRYNGAWMTFDEMRAAQGLVKYKGRWISAQERDQLEARSQKRVEVESWTRQIRVLAQNLFAGTLEQREESSRQLEAIRDPNAVPALVAVLGPGGEAQRARLVQLLDAFPGLEARNALIDLLLVEQDPAVRQAIISALERRADPDVTSQLLNRLGAADPVLVGQAARSLADLRVLAAVPRLIKLLVRVETKMMVVPSSTPNNAVTTFTSSQAYGTLTGPVVGPGAVAFGATGIPYYSGTGVSLGSNRSLPSTVRLMTFVHRNADVLAALISLTGKDFGYDTASWQRWLATEFHAQDTPARRVPQP